MIKFLHIDEKLINADWPKRTKDTLKDLEEGAAREAANEAAQNESGHDSEDTTNIPESDDQKGYP